MDFLEIRRKAKERAAARAAAAEASRAAAVPAADPAEVARPSAQPPVSAPTDPPRPPLALEPLPLPAPPVEEEPAAPASPAWSSLEAKAKDGDGDGEGDGEGDGVGAPRGERPPADPEAERAAAAEAARLEAELEARLREMPLAADPRFRLWRPAGGPAPGPASAPEPPEPPEPRDRSEPPPRREEPRRAAEAHPPPAPPEAGEAAGDPLDEFFYRDSEAGPGLAVLGAAAEPAAAEPETAPRAEYLTFWLGAEEYAVAIGQVREVMRSPPITEVPRAPAGVLGVITVRGEVVAVFDPRLRLGLPPAPSAGGGRVVIVDGGAGPCGLSVDAVASVVRLPRSAIEPRPQGMGGAAADCLEGIGRERDRLFTVLSVPALLRPARSPEGPG